MAVHSVLKSALSIDHMESVLYTAHKREAKSCLAFIRCSEPFPKCHLVHWYFGFVPREPFDFGMKIPHDRMNTSDKNLL